MKHLMANFEPVLLKNVGTKDSHTLKVYKDRGGYQGLDAALAKSPAGSNLPAWAEPVEGECPHGFPVKAKVRSGIYREPGMLNYERTAPDRCYASADAAEADGLRAAKR